MMKVLAAYFLDLALGDPEGYPHPVVVIGKAVTWLEEGLRRRARSSRELKTASFALCFLIVASSFISSYALILLARLIHPYLGDLLEIFIIYTCLATRELGRAANRVYDALIRGELAEARARLSYIVSRDTHRMNQEEVSRGAVETVAENISDAIIAPLFYAFIGGAPLALFYKATNTLDSMVGYTNEKYRDIGYASAKLDDILNFIPARITALLIVLASFLMGYDYKNCWHVLLRDRLKHKSPNSAHGEAAVAGALNIQLGGINYYFGRPEMRPILGDKRTEISPGHIKDSIRIMYASSILGIVSFYVFYALVLLF